MSASKSTYLHGFPAFPCTISLSKGHFPDHIGLVLGQKPDTYCRIPRKLFFVFGHKKSRDAGMHPWTAIRQVDTKNKPRRRIARHYAALLRISNGVRPFFISMRW